MSRSLYEISLKSIDGKDTSLGEFRGKVALIVNVASKCGLTPQYEGLEKTYEHYQDRDFVVLGFPCNDFGAQEPGTETEIQDFCTSNFGVKFPMFGKLNVNSPPRHPLYAALIEAQPAAEPSSNGGLRDKLAQHNMLPKDDSDVMWNFEKFLISRDGQVIGRFAPDTAPDDPKLLKAIEAALAA